jgi:hypothetical protein
MIRTKYVTTSSKESYDENQILLSIDEGGDLSIIKMKPMQAILLYADQVEALLSFLRNKEMKQK